MLIFLKLFLCLSGFLWNINAQTTSTSYGSCTTPNGQTGQCVGLQGCTSLFSLLQKSNSLTNQEREYLAKSQCGFISSLNLVLICCPPTSPSPSTGSSVSSSGGNLLLKAPNCGKQLSDRIVGGEETSLGEFPWVVLIEYTKPDNTKGHHCGGTLISNRYVLTAAHCISGLGVPTTWRVTGVRLGEWDTSTNPDFVVDARGRRDTALPHVDVPVEQTIVHSQYAPSAKNQLNDIALIRLRQTVEFTDFIQPVCLPTSTSFGGSGQVGAKMDVVGWGATENNQPSTRKLKAAVDVWDLEKCKAQYGRSNIQLQSSQMCAGGQLGVDSCRGDSGGPLLVEQYVNKIPYYYLTGVVSFGPTPCGLQNWPGVYTRVGNYINWIESNIKA